MNSIDCVLAAKAFDVLIWASQEKELAEAEYMDYEEERKKHK